MEEFLHALGSHGDLLISYNRVMLAHVSSITKVTSYEPHLNISTTSTKNAIFPCVSPNNSCRDTIAISCMNYLLGVFALIMKLPLPVVLVSLHTLE
jgi:hypothetical protein